MSMHYQVRSVPIDHLSQSRRTEIREDLRILADHGCWYRRVVHHDHSFRRPQLRQRAFQLQAFINSSLHEGLNLALAKCREDTAPESAEESFCACEADAVTLVACTVQHLDAFS